MSFWNFFRYFKPIKMKGEYEKMYESAVVKKDKVAEVKWVIGRIEKSKARYESVCKTFPGMPYWYVGIIHIMEGGGKFTTHLHNGDPLTSKTVNVPKGRPKWGNPPYTWEDSAMDALIYTDHLNVTDWSIGNILTMFEKYNGLGYKKKGLPSPYLWSYTQHYTKGKYVADGKFDPNAVSKQPGVAAIMKLLNV